MDILALCQHPNRCMKHSKVSDIWFPFVPSLIRGGWRTSDARIAALAEPADKDVPSISRIHLMCFQTNFFHPSWASCSPTIPSPPRAHTTDTDYLSVLLPTTSRVS